VEWDKVTELKWLPLCLGLFLILAAPLSYLTIVFAAWWFGVPLSPD
jgi:hypothetical protein